MRNDGPRIARSDLIVRKTQRENAITDRIGLGNECEDERTARKGLGRDRAGSRTTPRLKKGQVERKQGHK